MFNHMCLLHVFVQMDAMMAKKDPLGVICNEHSLQLLGMPTNVPVTDMEKRICGANWPEVVSQFTSLATSADTFIQEVYCFHP